jgi:hypothetical protein
MSFIISKQKEFTDYFHVCNSCGAKVQTNEDRGLRGIIPLGWTRSMDYRPEIKMRVVLHRCAACNTQGKTRDHRIILGR